MIKVEKLIKNYYQGEITIPVLRGIDLTINNNDFVAIIGKSGAGKSTLLYQLGLLDHPTSGKIFINDKEVTSLNSKQRTDYRLRYLGYVFQDYALLPELTALENVSLPLMMMGQGKAASFEKSITALKQVDLADKINNLPSQLSGGQQQRVSIARAIAHDPKIIFADEPTANLDSVTSKNILDVFAKLHEAGQTIVMVTHELDYARTAGRIVEISDGMIISDRRA